MADQGKIKQAQATFQTLCNMLDSINWNYEKDEEELKIRTHARGDDLPMDVRITVDPDRELVILLSPLPFSIGEEKRSEVAVAISCINLGIVNGSFDYNYLTGDVFFRITSSFMESLIGPEMFHYLMGVSFQTIDEYNDKILMVSKGNMSIPEIIQYMKN